MAQTDRVIAGHTEHPPYLADCRSVARRKEVITFYSIMKYFLVTNFQAYYFPAGLYNCPLLKYSAADFISPMIRYVSAILR